MEKLPHYPMVINGQLISTGSQDLINPAPGKVFATVAAETPEDLNQAVIAAQTAQNNQAYRHSPWRVNAAQ